MAVVKLLQGRLHRASTEAAGFDLFATSSVLIPAGQRRLVPTGVVTAIDSGYCGLIRDRSGLAAKHGLTVLAGVIDADYDREWKVVLLNTGTEDVIINAGDRAAQVVFLPVLSSVEVVGTAEVSQGPARDGGFGSSGA